MGPESLLTPPLTSAMPPVTESPMLPICMEDTATVLSVVLTPMVWDTMVSLDTHMATPLTTERDPLMLSQRPMPTTVTTDTELFPMLDMVTAPTDHTVWLTVMAEASTTKSLPKESRTRENSRFIQRLLS